MIPKLENSFSAIDAGVSQVVITLASAISEGSGTVIKNNSKQAGECNFSVTHPSLLQSNARDQFPKRYSAPERQTLQVGASYYAE